MSPVYFDYNATAPCREEVLAAVAQAARNAWGNASSAHREGRAARATIESARDRIAETLGAHPIEIVFTAGGTEADNLAIAGCCAAARETPTPRIVTTVIEHAAVLETCRRLEERSVEVERVACGPGGRVSGDDVAAALRDGDALVSIMHANNETGVIQPVGEVAEAARERGIPVHADAVQTLGKLGFDVSRPRVDLLSVSGHKIGGPKGVGVLYVRKGTPLQPILTGGHQERTRRAGTENAPAIAGMAIAVGLAVVEQKEETARLAALRGRLESGLRADIPDLQVNGTAPRIANTLNVSVPGVPGMDAMVALDLEGISVSTGSACAVGSIEPSKVLTAMGLPEARVKGALRISLGRLTTGAEIDRFLDRFPRVIKRLRRGGPDENHA